MTTSRPSVHLLRWMIRAAREAGDLAAILSSLEEGDVLFIDEIHRLARTAEEMLYLAMEDYRVDVVVGKGPGATSIPLSLPPFTVVGATTRAGLLPAPLRDRFGFTGHLEYYGPGELSRILARSAGLLGVNLEEEAAGELAGWECWAGESDEGPVGVGEVTQASVIADTLTRSAALRRPDGAQCLMVRSAVRVRHNSAHAHPYRLRPRRLRAQERRDRAFAEGGVRRHRPRSPLLRPR